MYILHIETSTAVCSIALSKGRHLVCHNDMAEGMNHTARLTPAIEALLFSAGLKPSDLGAVSVSSGPGSYTGLRVGGSSAKAIAYSLGIPLVAIPALMSLAQGAFDKHPEAKYALPMIDARRKEVYAALYDRQMNELIPVSAVILSESALSGMISASGLTYCCGDGAMKVGELATGSANLLVDRDIQSSARYMIQLAVDRLEQGKIEDPLHFVPFYLKPPNITESKKSM